MANTRRIFITGGTGFIGSALARRLARDGHEVTILSRSVPQPGNWPAGIEFVQGDPSQPGAWQARVADCDAVFNLAGAPIFHFWTRRYKELIHSSRVQSTARIVEAMAAGSGGSRRLISASAVGFYGFHGEEILAEDAQQGADFLARVSGDWEAEALKARSHGIRVILPRFGIILGRSGGALRAMLPAFRMGAGGVIGSGRQGFPWIHLEDAVDALVFLMQSPEAEGPVNLSAPESVTNREFTRALGSALHRPTILPAPAFIVKVLLGEFGTTLLNGQRAVPQQLLGLGFPFRFATLKTALEDLVGRTCT